MKLFSIPFSLVLILITGLLIISRFYNFGTELEFVSDNGTEFAVLAAMNQSKCMPLVGPLVSADQIFIPPTYFYLIQILGLFSENPLVTGVMMVILNCLTVMILGLTIWLLTNRKIFLASSIFLILCFAIFVESRAIWHPYPVSFFFGLSLLFLAIAKKYRRFNALIIALVSFWFSLSIYPSPLPLLPWLVWEALTWYRTRQKNWLVAILLTGSMMALTALPVIFPQLVYESQHDWPTLRTIFFSTAESLPQPFSVLNKITIYAMVIENFVIHHLGIRETSQWFGLEKILLGIGFGILIVASIGQKSHHWLFKFPYPFLVGFVITLLLRDKFGLEGFRAHIFIPLLMLLIVSVAEAAVKLKLRFWVKIFLVFLFGLVIVNNGQRIWQSYTDRAIQNRYSLSHKIERMEIIRKYLISKNLSFEKTLILDSTSLDTSYDDPHHLQFDAMDNWTLLDYETLIPRLNKNCNQYNFFSLSEIKQKADTIILIESDDRQAMTPQTLFGSYLIKQRVELNQGIHLVKYRKFNSSLDQDTEL